jgi:hypothetical protein
MENFCITRYIKIQEGANIIQWKVFDLTKSFCRREVHPQGWNSLIKILVHFVENALKSIERARRNIFVLISTKIELNTYGFPNVWLAEKRHHAWTSIL